MPTQVQFRRGTTSQNDSFTGANGEISVDTTLDQLRLHDGFTAGGFKVGRGVDVDDRMQVANTQALHSSVTANLNSYIANTNPRITNLNSSGEHTAHFIPSANITYDLGSDTQRWRDIYLSGTSINLGDATITAQGSAITLPSGSSISGTGDITNLVNDRMQVANTQALHSSVTANLNSYIANTNPRIDNILTSISGTNTSIRTLVSDRMQVANTIALANARLGATASVTLSGDVSGSASFSGNSVSITTTVADDSHNHIIGNVDGLQAALDNRMTVANTQTLVGDRLGATATVQITGDVAGGPTAFSGNTVSIAVTQQNNSVDLGTHTTGNYVATISGTANEVEVSGSGSETAAVTIGLPNDVTVTGDLTVSGGDITLGGTGRIQGIDTVSAGTDAANKTYVDNAVAGVVDSAPAALDTLNELAAALGDDANFATTVSTNIGQKLGATATVTLTGDITGSASFSANAVSIATTYNNDVVLGTDTSGNYIASLTVGTGLDTTTATGEGSTPNITLDLSELSTSTSDGDGDFFVVVDASNVQRKLTKGNINISGFNNDSGYSTTTGTVTSVGVSAGTGLSGGGTVTSSGTISLALDMSELTDMTATMVGTDEFIVLDAGADRRKAANEIGLSIFNNDAGFSTTTGTVTSVATGTGLTGGTITSSGTISLATAGAGAGTYGSTSNNTKIDTITLDAYGRVTAVATGGTGDVDGVTAGTNLNGGGTSGTVTLNLDSALTSITSIGITNGGTLKDATGNYGSIEVDGGGAGGYEGYSIGGRAVFMHDNSSTTGLYNDVNNHWLVRCVHGGGASLYHNGSEKVVTTSSGANINGDLNAVDNIYLAQSIYHEGDTNTYMQFHAGDQWRVVTGGTERLEVKNSSPHVLVTGTLNATTDVQVNGTSVATSADVNGKAIAFSIVFG